MVHIILLEVEGNFQSALLNDSSESNFGIGLQREYAKGA